VLPPLASGAARRLLLRLRGVAVPLATKEAGRAAGCVWTAASPFPAWSACAAPSVPATGLSLRSFRAPIDLFRAAGCL
jgi:hypothetical protein